MAKEPEVTAPNPEMEELRRQLAEARGRAETAEARAGTEASARHAAELKTMTAAEQRIVAQQEACNSSISALTSEADALQSQMVALQREGNFEEAAAVSRKMARAEATLFNEQARKDWLAQQREQAKMQNETARAAPAPNPGERFLADGRPLSVFDNQPSVKAWLLKHEQVFTDKKFLSQLMSAHYSAVAADLTPGSNDYLSHLDQVVGGGSNSGLDNTAGATADSPYSGGSNRNGSGVNGDLDYSIDRPQRSAAGVGSLGGAPPSRQVPRSDGGSAAAPYKPLSEEEREVADSLYAHVPNLSDRYQTYRDHQDYMKTKVSQRNH